MTTAPLTREEGDRLVELVRDTQGAMLMLVECYVRIDRQMTELLRTVKDKA